MGKGAARALVLVWVAALLAVSAGGCGSSGADGGDGTGEEPAAPQAAERAALEKYRWYLERKAMSLVDWTEQLWGQIVVGEAGKAQSRYATSRVQYGQLLPAPHLLPALDLRINGQRSEQEGEFAGFHRIERSLFGQESTAGLKPVAKALVEDVQRLRREMKSVPLEPAEIAQSAQALLEEVVDKKLAGGEEPHSGTDLVDVSASVEGAERAFEAVRPRLTAANPDLVLQIEAQFAEAYGPLSELGSPGRQTQPRDPAAGAIFANHDELTSAEIEQVAAPIRRLAQTFSQVPGQPSDS